MQIWMSNQQRVQRINSILSLPIQSVLPWTHHSGTLNILLTCNSISAEHLSTYNTTPASSTTAHPPTPTGSQSGLLRETFFCKALAVKPKGDPWHNTAHKDSDTESGGALGVDDRMPAGLLTILLSGSLELLPSQISNRYMYRIWHQKSQNIINLCNHCNWKHIINKSRQTGKDKYM